MEVILQHEDFSNGKWVVDLKPMIALFIELHNVITTSINITDHRNQPANIYVPSPIIYQENRYDEEKNLTFFLIWDPLDDETVS